MLAGGGELTPPYTPRRYLEAIEEFLRYGVDILVVDSFSHCWEGPGGVLEMAYQAEEQGRKGISKWLGPKRDYKKLVSFLLSTRLHMILWQTPHDIFGVSLCRVHHDEQHRTPPPKAQTASGRGPSNG